MASSAIGKKCASCGLSKNKIVGRKKTVDTDDEATALSDCFAKTFVVGDILCPKCSCKARFAKSKARKLREIQNVENTTQSDSQESSSSSDPPSPQSKKDPDYNPPKTKATERETIELPLKRVVATHNYCCLCRNKSAIVIVPFEARRQAFVEKQIFVPEGNRCCQKHLIEKLFDADELENLKIQSHSCMATAKDLTKLGIPSYECN